jgi:hypothetical protein
MLHPNGAARTIAGILALTLATGDVVNPAVISQVALVVNKMLAAADGNPHGAVIVCGYLSPGEPTDLAKVERVCQMVDAARRRMKRQATAA